MDIICFLLRHTPFWSIPVAIIGFEFTYIFWLRRKTRTYRTFFAISVTSLIVTGYYYWAGGPEKAVSLFLDFLR